MPPEHHEDDVISNLPRDVIACILGKMPIRDAIRTSVLSKKWIFCCLNIPHLVFDAQFYRDGLYRTKHDSFSSTSNKFHIFEQIVTKSLLLHSGGIESFSVFISYNFRGSPIRDVNKWILFLSTKNIKRLTLEYEVNVDHKLPPYFFSCLDLTFLKLKNFVLSSTKEFRGFRNLKQLIVIGINFANNCFQSFLSSCPLLTRLELHGCSGIHRSDISGSNLKFLSIKDADNPRISLDNAPNLSEVSISLKSVASNPVSDLAKLMDSLSKVKFSNLVKFMDSLPKVKILHLCGKFLQFLDETPVPPMLSVSPYCLKVLEFKGVNFMNFGQISGVVCLLRSAPNLLELYIEASTIMQYEEEVSDYLKSLDRTTFSLSKVHKVKVAEILGFDPELEFIRFLLFSLPSLATLCITEHPNLTPNKAVDIARKLLKFRPPTTVQIDFKQK